MPTIPIQSLDRGLTLLEMVARAKQPVSLAEFTATLQIDRSSAFRLANTLRQRGYLVQLPSGKGYVLGLAARRLFHVFHLDGLLLEFALEPIRELAAQTGETTHLAILEGNQAALIAHQISGQPVGVSTGSGFCVPLHSTSVGKALLMDCDEGALLAIVGNKPLKAYTKKTICTLPELARDCLIAKQRGYALDDEENAEGVCCLSVPIRDNDEQIIASIGISAPVGRLPNALHETMAQKIKIMARDIGIKLGRKDTANS